MGTRYLLSSHSQLSSRREAEIQQQQLYWKHTPPPYYQFPYPPNNIVSLSSPFLSLQAAFPLDKITIPKAALIVENHFLWWSSMLYLRTPKQHDASALSSGVLHSRNKITVSCAGEKLIGW
jgi:hypothetical protein